MICKLVVNKVAMSSLPASGTWLWPKNTGETAKIKTNPSTCGPRLVSTFCRAKASRWSAWCGCQCRGAETKSTSVRSEESAQIGYIKQLQRLVLFRLKRGIYSRYVIICATWCLIVDIVIITVFRRACPSLNGNTTAGYQGLVTFHLGGFAEPARTDAAASTSEHPGEVFSVRTRHGR